MKKTMILIVMLLFGLTFLGAQTIGEYIYSTNTTGTLQDMTGATSLLTAATYHDDDASAVTNIGFNFKFGGVWYTQFSANSNGQMQLGATVISGGSASPSSNTARIAPLSGDNSIQTTGAVQFLVTGSAPNRKLIVEWLNLRVNYTNDTTGTYCRMQAWLYEGSNNIDFVYGTMWNMSTSAQSRGVYIATGVTAGAIGQILTINTTPAYSNTATSLTTTSFTASSAMTNLNSAADGSRRVFSFACPAATALPNSAVPTFPADAGWAFVGSSLSWTPGSTVGGAYVDSYDVYFGTTSSPTFIQNQIQNTYTPTLAANTTYYWKIVPRNSFGAAAACPTWSFKTPSATQLAESFENTTFPPAGWARTTSSTSYWTRSTSQYSHGVASMYAYTSTTTLYDISTPKCTIVTGSTLNFKTMATATSQILRVIYSPDRITWTQIGSDITYAAASTWYNINVDLSSIPGNYYLGFRSPAQTTGTYSIYVDAVFGPEITPEAPGAPVLSTPADLATNVNELATFTWTAPTTGGVPTGYRLYVGTTNPPTTVAYDGNLLTKTLTTPLNYNTLYYWTVEAYNGAGTGAQATVRSFTTRSNPVISTFPYTAGDFENAGALPPNWLASEGAAGASYHWAAKSGAASHGPAASHGGTYYGWLYCYLASTSYNPYYLTTAPMSLGADAKRLTYWYWIGTDTYTNPLFVEISTDNQATWTTLYTHSNTSNTLAWYQNTISLEAYANTTAYIRFKGMSNYGNNITDLGLDDVVVENIPAAPIFSLTPNVTSWDFGMVPVDNPATKQFTISNVGGGTLNLNSVTATGLYYSISVAPTDTQLTAGESTTFTVQYLPTAAGGPYTGTITINDSRAVTNIALTGSAYAPATLPFTETWEAGQGAWQFVNGTQVNQWYIGTVAPHGGSNSAFISNDSGVTNAYTTGTIAVVHMYQDITFTPGDYEYNLSFWHKTQGESTFDGLKVFLVDTSVTPEAGTQLTTGQIGNTWYNLVADWTNVVIPIPNSFAGTTKRLVFTWVNDSSLGTTPPTSLDDINLTAYEMAAPEAPVLVYPTDNQTNLPKSGFNLSWTRSPTGSAPTSYIVHMGSSPETVYTEGYDWEVTTTTFNPVTSATNPLTYAYGSIWYWTVEAVNLLGGTPYEPPRRFTIEPDPAITALPYAQNFDGVTTPAFPSGWTAYKSYSSSSLNTSTTYSQSSPNSVYLYNYTTTETMRLISPQILVPINGIKLSFWLRASGTGYTMKVGTVSALDGTGVFTQVAAITPATSGVFTQYTVSFAGYSGTDQYICFQHGVVGTYQSFYLDTVLFEALLANDMAATGISGINWGIASNQLSYIISVKNNGTATQNSYTVKLMSQDTRTELASLLVNTPLASDATAVHTLNWTPTTAATYNLYGQVVLTGDQYAGNDNTAILPVAVFPVGTFLPQIGDINSTTTTNSVPINVYWKNSLCETVYLAHELQMTSGTINALIFQNNFTQDITKPIKIWMKHTTATSLETAYLGFDGYTLVFDGNVHFPLGTNFIVIPLSTPFNYTGGNLAVRTYRVWENVYWNNTNLFYYTDSPENPNRSRYYYADQTSAFDPVLLLDYLGVAFTGTATNYIPNTAFIVYPASPVTSLTAPVVSIANVGTNAVLTWPAVTGAYSYRVYASDDPYSFVGDPVATVHINSYTVAGVAKKFFKVVAISSYRSGDAGLTLDPALLKWDNSRVVPDLSPGKTDNKD